MINFYLPASAEDARLHVVREGPRDLPTIVVHEEDPEFDQFIEGMRIESEEIGNPPEYT